MNEQSHFTSKGSELKHEEWLRKQKALWEKRADSYENLDWVKKEDFLVFMVDLCEPQSDWTVLDAGSGTGIVTAAIEPRVAHVHGIDLTKRMVDLASEKYAGNDKLTFVQGNVEEMDFDDSTFDLVTARMVFHHVDDCIKGLSEILRVLKPGGGLVLCEGVPPDHRTRERYERIFALKEKRHTFSEAELINMFDAAGFLNVTLTPFFMRQVSLNNWLASAAISEEAINEIRRLHVEADDYFKRIYRIFEINDDVFMDWKFSFVKGFKG